MAMQTDCVREQDVLDAITAGRWPGGRPERTDVELWEHVRQCRICQDVAAVFAAISEERDGAMGEEAVPPSSLVWWRAQMRAREEAERAAGRPIALVQAVAVASLIAAAVALLPLALLSVKSAAVSVAGAAAWVAPRAEAISNAFTLVTGTSLPIVPFAVASVLLAPILLYYALTEE
jgi:hypothetical protein